MKKFLVIDYFFRVIYLFSCSYPDADYIVLKFLFIQVLEIDISDLIKNPVFIYMNVNQLNIGWYTYFKHLDHQTYSSDEII